MIEARRGEGMFKSQGLIICAFNLIKKVHAGYSILAMIRLYASQQRLYCK